VLTDGGEAIEQQIRQGRLVVRDLGSRRHSLQHGGRCRLGLTGKLCRQERFQQGVAGQAA
jgi:hypothetical protein